MMKEKRIIFTIFCRSFFIQSLWNFERMQNIGFVYGLLPFFRELYPDPEKRREVLQRHLGFFNTHPYMVNIIFGTVASMEREIVRGHAVKPEDITTLKTHMAGPLAAIGDTFFWATWRPFAALLSAGLVMFFADITTFRGTWLIPIFFLFVYNIIHVPFRYWSLRVSYHVRTRVVKVIAGLEFQNTIDLIRFAGLSAMAFILVFYVWVFGAHVTERAFFAVIFAATVALGCLRLPPAFLLYGVLAFSMTIGWLVMKSS